MNAGYGQATHTLQDHTLLGQARGPVSIASRRKRRDHDIESYGSLFEAIPCPTFSAIWSKARAALLTSVSKPLGWSDAEFETAISLAPQEVRQRQKEHQD